MFIYAAVFSGVAYYCGGRAWVGSSMRHRAGRKEVILLKPGGGPDQHGGCVRQAAADEVHVDLVYA